MGWIKAITGPVRPNEHPEINKPEPAPKPLKGDTAAQRDAVAEAARVAAVEEAERQARITEYEWKQQHEPRKVDPTR